MFNQEEIEVLSKDKSLEKQEIEVLPKERER
jgi:hypothetical protein